MSDKTQVYIRAYDWSEGGRHRPLIVFLAIGVCLATAFVCNKIQLFPWGEAQVTDGNTGNNGHEGYNEIISGDPSDGELNWLKREITDDGVWRLSFDGERLQNASLTEVRVLTGCTGEGKATLKRSLWQIAGDGRPIKTHLGNVFRIIVHRFRQHLGNIIPNQSESAHISNLMR